MILSIGILISNRIETVRKCLESVKPLLDKGIAELICVDTVTTTPGLVSDGSAELAGKYGTKVVEFAWVRDFSKARNITLENATGEWYLYLDDDEWFDNISELVEFFESGEYRKYQSASIIIRNYQNKAGTEWTDTRVVRLVKRSESLHFTGKVHEALSELHLPCKEFASYAHHYGYAYDGEEEKIRHRERNLSLLLEEIKERPEELRLRTQLALEYATYDNERALQYVKEILADFTGHEQEPCYQWMISLMFPLYEAMEMGTEKVRELYEAVHRDYPILEFAELSINYNTARQYLIADNPAGAIPYLEKYFEVYEVLSKDKTMQQLQNTVDFEKYISQNVYTEAKNWLEYSKAVSRSAKSAAESLEAAMSVLKEEACQDHYENVLALKDELDSKFVLSPSDRLVISCIVAEQAAKKRDLDTFFENLMEYIACYDEIVGKAANELSEAARVFSEYLHQEQYYKLLWYGAAFANKIGEYSVANMFWKRFDFEKMKPEERAKYAGDLKDTIDGLKK